MSRTSLCLALLAAVLSPAAAFAQHHHHIHVQSYTHHHHAGTWNYGTHHHHTNYVTQYHHHQHNWNYVAPYHSHYHHHYHNHGTYYVSGGNYYFTPTVVLRTAAIGAGSVSLAGGPVMGAPMWASGAVNLQPPQMGQPVQLQYGAFAYHQDLGGRLEAEVNAMCLDLHYNYQQNPGYAAIYRAAYEILQAAKYVHAQEHLGNRDEIRRHVSDIDNLFHTVQTELPRLTRTSYKQIAMGDVVAKSQDVEALLHHLAYDVGVELHAPLEEAPAPPGFFAPGANGPASNVPPANTPQPPLAVPDLPKT